MDVLLSSTTLSTTKSNQDMTPESIFELLRADYLNNSNVDDATNYKFIISLSQPSNINKLKRLFDEINDPGYGLYIIERLAQHAKRLGRASEYADVSIERAKIIANGLRGAGIGFMGVGVGFAKATAASSAATAAYQGVCGRSGGQWGSAYLTWDCNNSVHS